MPANGRWDLIRRLKVKYLYSALFLQYRKVFYSINLIQYERSVVCEEANKYLWIVYIRFSTD